MKIALYGSGGREHALADSFVGHGHEVIAFPGNPGMAMIAEISPGPFESIDADLYVVGPEVPLVEGLADTLRGRGKLVVGPGKDGAQLEGSKAWMKEILASAKIPTASFMSFSDVVSAHAYLDSYGGPYVIKTDGLAAGKGVLVTSNREEAKSDVADKLSGKSFGSAGTKVVIEEAMNGPELSLLVLCDGTKGFALCPATDFKRIFDNDLGPNTGGMGAFSPVPGVGADLIERIMNESITPLIDEFKLRGIDYRGILYAGLMLTVSGPKIIEFNIRFGDPETQVVVPRIKNDLAQMLLEVAKGDLTTKPEFSDREMVTVVLASEGYPLHPVYGAKIQGLDSPQEGIRMFHAGTKRNAGNEYVVGGGRVLNVTAEGVNLKEARDRAYKAIEKISFANMQFRRDIALEASGKQSAYSG